jgi:S1-C subfamily serine protease
MNDEPDSAAIDPTDPAAARLIAPTSPSEHTGTPLRRFAFPPRRPWRWAVLIAFLIIAAILMGVAIGYGFWGSSATTSSQGQPSGGSGSTGSGGSPNGFSGGAPNGYGSGGSPYGYGDGSPSGYGSPNGYGYGSGGSSSGSGSSGSGGPSNVSSIASAVSPGLVDINVTLAYQNGEAAATGIVLSPSGEVLTNNHVVEGAGAISATDVGNGKTYKATVVGYDRSHDIAVLQLSGASGLQTASLGDSSTVAVGQAVVAIGNAGGAGGKPSAAGGSVTALNQQIVADGASGSERLSGLIEVNADVQPGDSGGPLVDSAGKAIGVDTAASVGFSFRSAGGGGYAVPINQALAIAKQIENGVSSTTVHVGPTAFLGVELATSAGQGAFGQGFGSQGGSGASGATVADVLPDSPAERAGLHSGDVITSLGGQRVDSATALTSLVGSHRPGDHVQLRWTDLSGQHHTATVQLVSGPAT